MPRPRPPPPPRLAQRLAAGTAALVAAAVLALFAFRSTAPSALPPSAVDVVLPLLLEPGGRLPPACRGASAANASSLCRFRTSDFVRGDGGVLEWRLRASEPLHPLRVDHPSADEMVATGQPGTPPHPASDCLFAGTLGRVGESPDAHAATASLNLCKGGLSGLFWLDGAAWELEPAGGGFGAPHRLRTLRRLASPSTFHFRPSPNASQHRSERNRRRRSPGYSHEFFVEVLVVADRKMQAYHGHNLDEYILTLFSTVSNIYRHPSLEAAINIVVVRIDHAPSGLHVSQNAQETLKDFCKWQKNINELQDGHENHHDVAILLTRENICRAVGKCDTLGLAELGTMCDAYRSCAIIEDNGLSAAFTIAHELGHIFNFPHDDETKCGQFMELGPKNYHIMAPTLEFNTHPWSWSPCSAAMLQEFLDSPARSSCILARPVQQRYMARLSSGRTAGEVFPVREQCMFVFGAQADICAYMPACKRLWCQTDSGYQMGCRTQHMPWADGTPCGNTGNRWCYRGECVGVSPSERAPVDGSWGSWAPFGPCSRTCGGGVKKAKRACDNPMPANGGRYCSRGERVKYKPCATKECSREAPAFRASQCAAFNGRRVRIHGVPSNVTWIPKYQGIAYIERCKLHCEVAGSSAFYILKDKVSDGTPCGLDTDDMCVNGQCRPGGCDNRLDSPLRRDNCGVCGGNNASCTSRTGVYNQQIWGYSYVTTIPAGATHIDITQRASNGRVADDNYLALRNADHRWLLNGDFQITPFQHDVSVRGTVLHYSGSNTTHERINSTTATTEPISLHVLSVNELTDPQIEYTYVLSTADPQRRHQLAQRDFYWAQSEEWEPCNRLCQGRQQRRLRCVDSSHEEPAEDRLCHADPRPRVETRACNEDCRLKWDTAAVGSCNAECGHGVQAQRVFCVQESLRGARQTHVEEANCGPVSTRPKERRACYIDCAGRFWSYTDYGQCSVSCGGGTQRREALCRDSDNLSLDPGQCSRLPKEALERPCAAFRCTHWAYGDWEPCSRSCDGGQQRRRHWCDDGTGRETEAERCVGAPPHYVRACASEPCTAWDFGPWEPCTATCGEAYTSRRAVCLTSSGKTAADGDCVSSQRIVSKSCALADCPRWDLGTWSACSLTCLEGWRRRSVRCVDAQGSELAEDYCLRGSESGRPAVHKSCSGGPCPFWRAQEWSPCSVSCGEGTMARTVHCVSQGDVVDASICGNSEELSAQATCTLAACPQWEIGPHSPCPVSCGGGTAFRSVTCVLPGGGGRARDADCLERDRPRDSLRCNTQPCAAIPRLEAAAALHLRATQETSTENPPPLLVEEDDEDEDEEDTSSGPVRWVRGGWGACVGLCDGPASIGWQHRQVVCRDVYSRHMGAEYCSHARRPRDRKACRPCPSAQWSFGVWSECGATCGLQVFRRRRVFCDRTAEPTAECSVETKPAAEQLCDVPHCQGQELQPSVAAPPLFPDADHSLYKWRAGMWQQCSASCGGGTQTRSVTCEARVGAPLPVAEALCDGRRPAPTRECNQQRCQRLIWTTGKWSACSATCGRGTRRRDVLCTDAATWTTVDAGHCAGLERPKETHRCRIARCPRWRRTKWSVCSASCGEGVRHRRIECYLGRRRQLRQSECAALPKPQESVRCRNTACPSFNWAATDWSKCTETCREGRQVREVYCVNSLGQRAAPRMCEGDAAPPGVRSCISTRCPYSWVPGHWSQCSRSCGPGERYRELHCALRSPVFISKDEGEKANPDPGLRVPSVMCAGLEQPAVKEPCSAGSCDAAFTWSPGPWAPCSASCAQGLQKRAVHCLNQRGGKVHGKHCQKDLRPRKRRKCYLKNCQATDCEELKRESGLSEDGPQSVVVRGFPVSVYCHRMNETHPHTFLQPRSPDLNYAEIYGKRLLYPFTCPSNGERDEACQCTEKGNPKAGKTVFERIRVDLHNLKIIIQDFTFTRQAYGARVPLGVAGDCYSAVDCPQGRFRLDLGGTGLVIAGDSKWESHGHRTSMHVDRSDSGETVKGRCGGYCGQCYPDKWTGIRLAPAPLT